VLPISNVAIIISQFPLVIGNIDNWQHLHIGNILQAIRIYIRMRSAGDGLAYKFVWKQQKQLVKTTSSFSPRNCAALLKPGAVAPGY
jgi:hypothetical protein